MPDVMRVFWEQIFSLAFILSIGVGVKWCVAWILLNRLSLWWIIWAKKVLTILARSDAIAAVRSVMKYRVQQKFES